MLAPGEAADLLLRTGEVDDVDAAASSAAAEIAELCGNLPLYISICGGVILGYEGDVVWHTELVAMLKEDRAGVIDDGSGDFTVERLVDRSLDARAAAPSPPASALPTPSRCVRTRSAP